MERRRRFANDFNTTFKSIWEEFCKEYPQVNISFEEYKQICWTSNSMYAKYVMEGERVKLPQGFGSLAINKKKQTHKIIKDGKEKITLAVNWVESKKKGKKVYYSNLHTQEYRFKWYWFKNEVFLQHTQLWQFNATRMNSRHLAKLLKQENSPYLYIYKEWHSIKS